MEEFERNFRERAEIGASVSIWWNGDEVLSLADGWMEKERRRKWSTDTLVPVYSATKAPAAATVLLALETHGMGVDVPVREVCGRFPVAEATFGDVLSHRCGLAALDRAASVWNHAEVIAAIEAQAPNWDTCDGHGYHPRTYGFLLDEIVRRVSGVTLGEYWRTSIADPMGLEFWIGLPEREFPRVARLYPGKADKSDLTNPFYKAFHTPGTLTRRAFGSPRGLHSVAEMNEPKAWAASLPAMGGIGTARALAKFYQLAIGAIPGPLSAAARHALATRRVDGDDLVLCKRTCFSCGCQLDPLDCAGNKIRWNYGPNHPAFGHPGAGGSHGFGDPSTGISFAYVMNQMELSVLPGSKTLDMVRALFA